MRSGSWFRLEIRQLLTGRAWLGLALILSLLVGSTFAQAVGIFTDGSRSALTSPDLAPGLTPFDGILVPTFGSAYLVATLLLPFVAIRQIGQDRDSGALKILLGLGVSPLRLLLRKAIVLGVAWALFLVIPMGAVALWVKAGGHVHGAELAGLLVGHLLYGWVVLALALLAGSLGPSASTASLLVLGATLGSWALDFEGAMGTGWMARLVPLSLTQALRPLERGLLPLGHLLSWPLLIVVALGLAAVWIHPGRARARKLLATLGSVVLVGATFVGASSLRTSWDLTEDRRHSFPAPVERALRGLTDRLGIEVRLSAEDPRWMDMDRSLMRKLQRVVPHIQIHRTGESATLGRFGQGGDDRYGEVVYRYAGRKATSRSTSPEEVLPLLWSLTGTPPPPEGAEVAYGGHPLALETTPGLLWFRVLIPLLCLSLWAFQRWHRPRVL